MLSFASSNKFQNSPVLNALGLPVHSDQLSCPYRRKAHPYTTTVLFFHCALIIEYWFRLTKASSSTHLQCSPNGL